MAIMAQSGTLTQQQRSCKHEAMNYYRYYRYSLPVLVPVLLVLVTNAFTGTTSSTAGTVLLLLGSTG
jgi:hypothetical protein